MTKMPPRYPDDSHAPLRVLQELRPALAGHAGIPQAARLLFRSLASLEDVRVEGLIQSTERVLTAGLPVREPNYLPKLRADQRLNRLGRVVIALEQGWWGSSVHATVQTLGMALNHLVGGTQALTRFDAQHFQDYVWRRLFAHTLPPGDFDLVARAHFRIARVPWFAMHLCGLATRRLGYPMYPRLDTSEFDVMIAETPYPGTVSRNTKLIVRYHDAIPMLMPHTISDRTLHQAFHYRALKKNVDSGAWFVCVSDATRRDLLAIFPQAEERSITIHNMVSPHYTAAPSDPERVPEILRTRLHQRVKPPLDTSTARAFLEKASTRRGFEYLLMVSTVEPRKNHLTLLSAWEKLRIEQFPDLKLIIVGSLGWHHKPIIRKYRPWLERGDAFLLEDVLASELQVLYSHAHAVICPSFGEGFDFSGVEAMMSGSPVVASDIPVHREVFQGAAQFFNPYSVDALAEALRIVIDPDKRAHRDELVARGAIVAARYTHDAITPKWRSFLQTAKLIAA